MSRSEAGPIWIVTGERGAGKTTFCRGVVDAARHRGFDVAGVLSAAHFDRGKKSGIDLQDPRFGARRTLARRRFTDSASDWLHAPRSTPVSTGRWAFNADALVWGDLLLQASVPCDLLIVDELGPLEFEHEAGWISGMRALDSQRYGGALAVVRPHFLNQAQHRWPEAHILRLNEAEGQQRRAEMMEQVLEGIVPRQDETHEDAARWNPRWTSRLHDLSHNCAHRPRSFLIDHLDDLPQSGLALDVAMGDGSNAEALMDRGLDVVGVDISDVALRHATDRHPQLMAVLGNLESINLPVSSFDVILNFYYLQRGLWPQYVKALRPGGLLVFETMSEATLTEDPHLNPDHLLKSGEVLAAFDALEALDHREVWLERRDEYPLAVESLLARRPCDDA